MKFLNVAPEKDLTCKIIPYGRNSIRYNRNRDFHILKSNTRTVVVQARSTEYADDYEDEYPRSDFKKSFVVLKNAPIQKLNTQVDSLLHIMRKIKGGTELLHDMATSINI